MTMLLLVVPNVSSLDLHRGEEGSVSVTCQNTGSEAVMVDVLQKSSGVGTNFADITPLGASEWELKPGEAKTVEISIKVPQEVRAGSSEKIEFYCRSLDPRFPIGPQSVIVDINVVDGSTSATSTQPGRTGEASGCPPDDPVCQALPGSIASQVAGLLQQLNLGFLIPGIMTALGAAGLAGLLGAAGVRPPPVPPPEIPGLGGPESPWTPPYGGTPATPSAPSQPSGPTIAQGPAPAPPTVTSDANPPSLPHTQSGTSAPPGTPGADGAQSPPVQPPVTPGEGSAPAPPTLVTSDANPLTTTQPPPVQPRVTPAPSFFPSGSQTEPTALSHLDSLVDKLVDTARKENVSRDAIMERWRKEFMDSDVSGGLGKEAQWRGLVNRLGDRMHERGISTTPSG